MVADDNAESYNTEPTLSFVGSDDKVQRHFIGIVAFLGRSSGCDIRLNGPDVQEVHCVLSRTTSGLVARDCCTPNGTFINGERVAETLLADGDRMQIGSFKIDVKVPPDQSSPLSDQQAQQDLIQQMARRISLLESKRRTHLQRAWTLRAQIGAAASGPAVDSLRAELELERQRFQSFRAESEKEFARLENPDVEELTQATLTALQTEWELDRSRFAAEKIKLETKSRALQAEIEALQKRKQAVGAGTDEQVAHLIEENERLQAELGALASAAAELQQMGGLEQYEQQLNDFRNQLSADAEKLQEREAEIVQREEETRRAHDEVQAKISGTEGELAAERAKIKREQALLERTLHETRIDLEQMKRESETLERDEKMQRLRTQIRGDGQEKEADGGRLSERIQRFLKGFGNK